jgi:lysophospholipase L1-like esterase
VIVLVGDSHLTEASSHGTIKLPSRLRQAGYQVESIAIGGLDTRSALADGLVIPPAAWTIYSFGSNDAAPWKEVSPEEYAANYSGLLATTSKAIVLGPPPVVEREQPPGTRTNSRLALYSEVASQVAARAGAHFVSLFDLIAMDGRHHVKDGVHLNDPAYEEIAIAVIGIVD